MDSELKKIIESVEDEHLEFKEAKERFDFDELTRQACALANAGGGKIVLGVSDKRPREIVGTKAFEQPERTRAGLMDCLPLRIGLQIFYAAGKRVLLFAIPSRPVGVPISYKGAYWTKKGDSLDSMSESELREIFAESGRDFSSEPCLTAEFNDLDDTAIEDFRRRWRTKTGNVRLDTISQEQLLIDCEAITRDGITYAALILFGTREALGRLLGQCEVIFEYRSSAASGPAQYRREFRQGFFSFYDQLWELVNQRNDLQHFSDSFFIFDVPTFEERTIREAILNAICHRNYQYGSSVFIRQYPQKLVIESPGGLPHDVTLKNILDRQSPRNRRLADIFSKCGLVERSGQGMNLMFEWSVKQAKRLPDFEKTDQHRVVLTLDGLVLDPQLLVMMEKIGKETLDTFSTSDFILLNEVPNDKPIPKELRSNISRLIQLGVLERISRGKFIFSKRYYDSTDQKGIYTRIKGLERASMKTLILSHIRGCGEDGSPLRELQQVLPERSASQIQVLLRELRDEGEIFLTGATRAGRWKLTNKNVSLSD